MAVLHSSTRDLTIHLPSTQMSSTASASASASATATATARLTCWCHQCDMSVTLLFSSASSSSPTISLPCPHCHSLSLEHMDSPPNIISNSDSDFLFADYDFDFDCDDSSSSDNASNSVTDAWQSSITSVVISDCLSQELCVICKDEFFVDSEAKQLPCKHLYHSHCILPWLSHHSSCPLCRFQLIPGQLHFLFILLHTCYTFFLFFFNAKFSLFESDCR